MTPRSFPPRNTSGAFTRCIKVVTRQTPSPPSLCRIRGNTKRETNTKGITVLWISVLRAGPRGSRKNVAVVLVIQIDLGKHSHLIKSEKKICSITENRIIIYIFMLCIFPPLLLCQWTNVFWNKMCRDQHCVITGGDKFLLIRHHGPKIFFYVLHLKVNLKIK